MTLKDFYQKGYIEIQQKALDTEKIQPSADDGLQLLLQSVHFSTACTILFWEPQKNYLLTQNTLNTSNTSSSHPSSFCCSVWLYQVYHLKVEPSCCIVASCQGGKKGRGPKAARAAPDPNKERFTNMLTSSSAGNGSPTCREDQVFRFFIGWEW